MPVLNYTIQGDNAGLLASIKQSIDGIGGLQSAIDKLNKTSLGGISGGFNTATQSATNFGNAAKKSTQSFTAQNISDALSRLDGKLAVTNGNFQLFGASIKNSQQTISAYQQAINSLLQNGIAPTDSRIVGFKQHIDDLTSSIQRQKAAASQYNPGSAILPPTTGGGLFSGIGGAIGGLAASYLSLYAVVGGAKKVIESNAEISDSLADIRRTAGLTQPEVENLFLSLKKIDTRTSLKGLADIAIIGGQLGIAKDQLAGFTKAVDQLSVSLSGELKGGPEEVAQSLGILDKVFAVSAQNGGDIERSFNKIGSVILGLGQSGLATGDFLTDFAKRVGGVAAQAKLGLPILLSYGAVLQEQGVSAEVAGTSFKKLLGSLATKREQFLPIAQIADSTLTLKSFTDIINNDTQKALSLFFQGLAQGGATTTAFSDLLKSVGLDAARSGQAITALALHQAELSKHIAESTQQYKDGTIAAEQFKIKNDTLGASLDKLGKSFVSLTTTGNVGGFFKGAIDRVTEFTGAIEKLTQSKSLSEFFSRYGKILSSGNILGILGVVDPTNHTQDVKSTIRENVSASTSKIDDFKKLNPTGASNDVVVDLLSDESAKKLKSLIDEYSLARTQAGKALSTLKAAEKSGLLSDDEEFNVAKLQKSYDQLGNILGIVSKAYVNVRDKAEAANPPSAIKGATEIADADLKTVKAINARISQLKNDALANPDNASADIARIDALRERLAQFAITAKSTGNSFLSISQALDDVLIRTQALGNASGLTGYSLGVEKILENYKKLNSEVDQNLAKAKLDLKNGSLTPSQFKTVQAQASTDKGAIAVSSQQQLDAEKTEQSQKVVDEINRINNEFGIKAEQSRLKEIDQVRATAEKEIAIQDSKSETIYQINERYKLAVLNAKGDKKAVADAQTLRDAEELQAKNSADTKVAIKAGELTAIGAINEKYLQQERDLYDKIAAINQQAIDEQTGADNSETARINKNFAERIVAVNKYFEELKKIRKTGDPTADKIATGIYDAQKKGVVDNLTTDQKQQIQLAISKPLIDGIDQAAANFYTTLTQINQQTDQSFKSIFADLAKQLSTSLNSVFLNIVEKGLQSALQNAIKNGTSSLFNTNGKITGLGAGIAAAGLAGGLISGATPATSTVGQGAGGLLSGAATGAAIGSVIPGLGTVAGAAIGGAIGLLGGIFSASKAQKELQAQQLAEQQQQTALLKASLAYTSQIIGRDTANGIVTGVTVGSLGQLIATVSGKDLQFVLDRNANGR